MKTVDEFLSFAETFPSAVAAAYGNCWAAEDVLRVVAEIRAAAHLAGPLTPCRPSFGALEPTPVE